jgi:hypothetical protein
MRVLSVIFVLIMAILVIASIKTIIPDSNGLQNLLGYRTCCPFTPASTLIGIVTVIILFIVAKRMAMI